MGCGGVAAACRRARSPTTTSAGRSQVSQHAWSPSGPTTSSSRRWSALARGHSLREAGVFSFESLSTDFILATLGLAVAAFWDLNPWLIPFAVAPLLLIHRSLAIPQLQAEARVDPKTGLYNARHFASVMQEELGRAQRFQRPMALIMADLDLLRDINNTYGHLAGDAVLRGVAEVFRQQLRHYDVPARFGGEEFSILLPETPPEQAFEIADRIRRSVAARLFEVETSSEPIRATISMGVAAFPRDGQDATELVHQADLAVYRAKLQGRNRVLDASDELLLAQPDNRTPRLASLPEGNERVVPLAAAAEIIPEVERRQTARPHQPPVPRFFEVPRRLALLVGLVGFLGIAAGIAGAIFGSSTDVIGLVTIVGLVGLGQVLSLEVEETGSISVSAVGALAAAAIIGPRAALVLAITMSAVEWSARRAVFHQLLFNVGALSFASLGAAAVFSVRLDGRRRHGHLRRRRAPRRPRLLRRQHGSRLDAPSASRAARTRSAVFKERFSWLAPHYAVYGFIAAVIYEAYKPIGAWAILVFALPLFLMRKTQEAYLKHTQRSAHKLRAAAETIQSQNVSLEQANKLLKERSTAAMESLSATVDARDAYTRRPLAPRPAARPRDRPRARRSRTPSWSCSAMPRSSTTSASSASRTRSC